MRNLNAFVLAALLVTATMGCSGKLNGIVRRDAGRIEIVYSDSRISKAELSVVLPDGQRFKGRSEKFDRYKEAAQADDFQVDDVSIHFENLSTFDGNTMASLGGNRGDVIKCRFRVTDTIIGFSSGGVGLCQISDGRVIDVYF